VNNTKYILERYNGKNRFTCPSCGKHKEFSRYIDVEAGEEMADHVGKCNRADKCGYHFTPKQYFESHGVKTYSGGSFKPKARCFKEMFTIPLDLMEDSLCEYNKNNFALMLKNLFGEEEAVKLIVNYACLGTSTRYPGAVIFWQLDVLGRVRTGKIINYDVSTFKRIKDSTKWAHGNSTNIPENKELKQCFFGEHLLRDNSEKVIAIVEAEKTAVICSYYMPEYIWLAAGSLEGLNQSKFQALKGRKVVLFPDLGAGYDKWRKKAEEFKSIANIKVSDYLERIATPEQIASGYDLADFLIEDQLKKIQASQQPAIAGLRLSLNEAKDFLSFCESLDKIFEYSKEII
jgi:hypothetical protein